MPLTATFLPTAVQLPLVRVQGPRDRFKCPGVSTVSFCPLASKSQCNGRATLTRPIRAGHGLHAPSLDKRSDITSKFRRQFSAVVCNAALNARCAEGQTATVTRENSTITNAPARGKEKSPDLDDGGAGFPPRDDGDGGGGGGGGGGNWKGGFFFFGFLAFLGFLKDQEDEGPYADKRRR